MADEEFEHANKFMEYQNKRGGTIVLLDIKVCQSFKYENNSKILFLIRNQHNKVGIHHLQLMKQHYNWKKMFIKHYLNYMAMLIDMSKMKLI